MRAFYPANAAVGKRFYHRPASGLVCFLCWLVYGHATAHNELVVIEAEPEAA